MNGKLVRRAVFGLAAAACAACWAYTFGTLAISGRPSVAEWTAMVTVSAIATEIMIWTGAFTLGWAAFANRRRLWERVTARFGGQA